VSKIKKLILKIDKKSDKLLVTIGAPKYATRGGKVKVSCGEIAAHLVKEGYKGVTSLQQDTYTNFTEEYKKEVVWEFKHELDKKPEPVKKPVTKKKTVAKKKTVPKKETPKPTEG
tara:strand:- start:3336 stop:3680 length:345 start_codon:yes stop_codon:yes gene_type:complete